MSGVNPQGCQVYSFKVPDAEDHAHDFLWRYEKVLPERGMIGIFNRSYYEDVLVVQVHPERMEDLPAAIGPDVNGFWEGRYKDINAFEKHLVRNGTVVLKFFLNISKEEQKRRLIDRLSHKEKYWKFSYSDVTERQVLGSGTWQRMRRCLNLHRQHMPLGLSSPRITSGWPVLLLPKQSLQPSRD